ncbi:MAG: hypothetical protein AAGE43_11855 [Pseudomonadota bacterium]
MDLQAEGRSLERTPDKAHADRGFVRGSKTSAVRETRVRVMRYRHQRSN